ncbi:MAG: hypothetical protein RLY87_282 [Chloroflexota bacterium]|jgi:zinc/manganese transport system substrate-binding protein
MSRISLLFMAVCLVLSSCTGAPVVAQKPNIIVSFSVLGDIVENIAGEAVSVQTLVGADSDAHAYEPTPQDGAALTQAAAIVTIGLNFEPWLEELYTASGSQAPIILSSTGITTIAPTEHDAEHSDEHEGEADPHIWHDVTNVISMVGTIRDALSAALPEHADTFAANSATYIATLNTLDADIQAEVSKIPLQNRKLVTNHDTFGYFSKRYGFTVVGTVLGVSTEGSDPSATAIVQLADEIRHSGVPAIFVENMSNSALIENVAREAGVVIAPPLYTDALGLADSPGATYVSMMRYNVATMKTALQGK